MANRVERVESAVFVGVGRFTVNICLCFCKFLVLIHEIKIQSLMFALLHYFGPPVLGHIKLNW